jgi:hypothetical protein
MKRISVLAGVLALTISGVVAQNGVVMDFIANSNNGAKSMIETYYGKDGMRTEMHISVPEMAIGGFARTMIIKNSKPDTKYMLDDKNKTYSVLANREIAVATQDATVKIAGKEKVGNYNCTHVIITKGNKILEYWVTTEIEGYESFTKSNAGNKYTASSADYSLMKSNGAPGFVVKSIVPEGKKGKMTMEFVKMEKKDLAADLFQVPQDYRMSSSNVSSSAQPTEEAKDKTPGAEEPKK